MHIYIVIFYLFIYFFLSFFLYFFCLFIFCLCNLFIYILVYLFILFFIYSFLSFFLSLLSPCAVFVSQDEPLPPVTAEEEREASCCTWTAIASLSDKSAKAVDLPDGSKMIQVPPLKQDHDMSHVTKSWR